MIEEKRNLYNPVMPQKKRDSIMTCYFRHLAAVFKKAGIEVTRENKRDIDKIIHLILNVDYPNCPAAWKQTKKRISEDEAAFVSELRNAWKTAKMHRNIVKFDCI